MPTSENNGDVIELIALPRMGKFNLFAAGQNENIVTVWSFREQRKISEFKTILDFGGFRLAMPSYSDLIISTGSWSRGVTSYTAEHGDILWSRSDLKNIQQVCDLSNNGLPLIGIGLDSGSYHILRVDTGEDHFKLAGVKNIYASPFEPFYLLVDSTRHIHLSTLRLPSIWEHPFNSFGMLHAAFSPEQIAFSEAGGCVSCFDFYGTKLWEFHPQADHHVLRLVWDIALQRWLAIDWNFKSGGTKHLFEIDIEGTARPLMSLGNCQQAEFSSDGTYLIISTGKVISTQSATTAWTFL